MLKLKKITLAILTVCLLVCVLGLIACGGNERLDVKFNNETEISVNFGEILTLPEVSATANETSYPVTVTVYNTDNIMQTVNNGKITVDDLSGYTIKYATEIDGIVYSSKTQVKVSPVAILIELANKKYECIVGEYVVIPQPTSTHVVEVAYTISVEKDGQQVQVENNFFLASELGEYTVTINAVDEQGNQGSYSYIVLSLPEEERGLIERFDSNWVGTDKQTNTTVEKINSSIESKYILDDDGYYAVINNSGGYVRWYLNIAHELEYYQELIEDGFTDISFWMYYTSGKNASHELSISAARGSQTVNVMLEPYTWQEITYPLYETPAPGREFSFIELFGYFKNQYKCLFLFNNSEDDYPETGRDDVKIYFSDIYAIKRLDESEIQTKDIDFENIKYGDVVDFSNFVQNDGIDNVSYYIEYPNGKTEAINGEYKFDVAGEYKFIYSCNSRGYRFHVEKEFNVDCGYNLALNQENVVLSSNGRCDFKDINLTISNNVGDNLAISNAVYKLYYNGLEVQTDSTGFDYTVNGTYNLEVLAEFQKNSNSYSIMQMFNVDLSTNGYKGELLFTDSSATNTVVWSGKGLQTNGTTEFGSYTVAGKTAEMYKFEYTTEALGVQLLPTYSIEYYEKLADLGAWFTFNYYYSLAPENTSPTRSVTLLGESGVNKEKDSWHTVTIKAKDIVEYFEHITSLEKGQSWDENERNIIKIYVASSVTNNRDCVLYMTQPKATWIEKTYNISTAQHFLELKYAESNDEYTLTNDITITVNGTGSLEAGSDAYWVKGTNSVYSIIDLFAGKLDGNGHKITIKNTTAFTGGSFAGLFNNVIADAVIENVIFDLQIKNGGNFTHSSFSTLIYKLEGTLKNCYVKTTLDGTAIGSQSSVIRTITTDASLENNIFKLDGNLGCVSRDTKYDSYAGAQIVIGKPSYYAFGTSNTRYTDMTNLAVYKNMEDMLDASVNGETYNVGTKHENGHGYAVGSYGNRDSKLEFGEPWTFDYENGELKLCGNTIPVEISSVNKIHITNVSEFLALKNSKAEDEYVLDNDITIIVNGTGSLETGSDTYWNGSDTHIYCLIQSFAGKLDGNGHKITIINTTAFTGGTFAGVFNNVKPNAVIENVVFDIQIKNGGNFTPANFSTLIYKLEGTLKNCYIKTTIDGSAIGSQSSVIRTIMTDATLKDNVFETDGKLGCISRDMKYDAYDGAQIVIGKPSYYAFGTSNTRYTDMANLAVYESIGDMLTANEYGEMYNVGAKHGSGHGYAEGSYGDKVSKLTFEDMNWTFDYVNGVLKLCGKTIV